jgi:nitrogen fixation NifU-like protein
MTDAFVRELLADHSRNPRHYGRLSNPDLECETENPQCVGPTHPDGDRVAVDVRLSEDSPPTVEAVRFTGEGCTLSQATASLLAEGMVDTPLAEVLAWDGAFIEDHVGMELTPARLQCAELVLLAVRQAVAADEALAFDSGS